MNWAIIAIALVPSAVLVGLAIHARLTRLKYGARELWDYLERPDDWGAR
jgi:hypothetical protein